MRRNSLHNTRTWLTLMGAVWTFLTTLTVEPIAFLNFLSLQLFHVVHQAGLYEVMCYQTFPESIHNVHSSVGHGSSSAHHGGGHEGGRGGGQHGGGGHGGGHGRGGGGGHIRDHVNSTIGNYNVTMVTGTGMVDCQRLGDTPDAEILVQQRMSELSMLLSLVHILPAMVAHVFLGAWGDKHGRKINILIGIAGLIINSLPFVVLFEYKLTPLWILVITGFIAGSTGYMGIVMISSFAYLADITVKKENITIRMVIYSIIMSFSGVVGSLLAAGLVARMRYSYVVVINIALLTVSFFYAFFRLHQIPPPIMKKLMLEKAAKMENLNLEEYKQKLELEENNNQKTPALDETLKREEQQDKLTKMQKIKQSIKDSWLLLKAVWLTYTKRRSGRNRVYLLMTASLFFLHLISNMPMHNTSLYLFRRPISWKAEDLSYWRAVSHVLHFVGNLVGVFVLKKLFKCKETTIILIALFSHFCQEVVIGLAVAGWMAYLSISVGCLGQLFMPTIKSYVAQLVDADEVGKSFVMFGLAHDIGGAISSVASNTIYRYTVAFFPGFLYLLCSGFLAIGFFVVLYIHIDSRRRENGQKKTTDAEKNSAVVLETKNGHIPSKFS